MGTKVIAPFNFDLQTAYAPLDHFALMMNASTVNYGSKHNSSAFKHFLMEGGAGVFTALWPNKYKHHRLRLELFGGYGIGSANIKLGPSYFFNPTSNVLQHEGEYHRKFLQAAMGLRGRRSEIAFAMRFTGVNFSRYKDFADDRQTAEGFYNFSALEPVLSWGVSSKKGRFIGQLGAVLPTNGFASEYHRANATGWAYFHLTVGFAFTNFLENIHRR